MTMLAYHFMLQTYYFDATITHFQVRDTENSIGVYGSYVLSGGDAIYNKIGIMNLDVKDIQSPYNHTESAVSVV